MVAGLYSQACWERFIQPAYAGPPPSDARVVVGRARGRAGDCEILIWLQREPRKGGFLAHAGPWGMAAADVAVSCWHAETGMPAASDLAEALSAPPEVMDEILTVEDAFRGALEQLETEHSDQSTR